MEKNMKNNAKAWIIFSELAGFMLVLLAVWLDEVVDLPRLLLGAPATPVRLQESLFESVFVILVGVSVVVGTRWLFRRIKELESYVIVCAWCRRVKVNDRWVSFEQYMSEKGNTMTSHGICETCAEKQIRELQSRRAAPSSRN
jgi:hypothetical protein